MSLQVAWRGRLEDPARIDEFENALAELAIACRGYFSPPHGEGRRRGAWLLLQPGLPQVPLLVAPDGSFAPEEDVPGGRVSCDTRWGSAEAHALLVEALDAIRAEFAPGMELNDGGIYWPKRRVEPLLGPHGCWVAAARFDRRRSHRCEPRFCTLRALAGGSRSLPTATTLRRTEAECARPREHAAGGGRAGDRGANADGGDFGGMADAIRSEGWAWRGRWSPGRRRSAG